MRLPLCPLIAAWALAAAPAGAAEPRAVSRLDYSSAETCPGEPELRSIVAARMGTDPFTAGPAPAAPTVRVIVERRPGGFAGTVELRDPAGRLVWSRPPLMDADCRRLVEVLGSISIPAAIDGPALPAVPIAPTMPPAAPPFPAPPPTPPPAAGPAFRVGARGGLAVGLTPTPTAHIAVDVGVGWPSFSLALEGGAALPMQGDADAGVRLRTSIVSGSLVPCGHYKWFVGCGLISVGALRAEAVNATTPATSTGIFVAAGARAGLEWPIVPAFALRLSADALVNLHPLGAQALKGPTPVQAIPVEAWRSGPFAGVLGAGFVARFGGS
jgi:hypothetical protein